MQHLLYKSDAVGSLGSDEIFKIIESAARNNPARDITGFLVFESGTFLQFIEGPQDQLDKLLAVLSKDSRHSNIEVLSREAQGERAFANWRMERVLVRHGETGALHAKLTDAGVPNDVAQSACEYFKAA